jgi:hypothetical protein
MNEAVFTVIEVAKEWKLSADTIQRWFVEEPGVMVIVNDVPKRRKRRVKRTLRIPASVKDRVWRLRSNPSKKAC